MTITTHFARVAVCNWTLSASHYIPSNFTMASPPQEVQVKYQELMQECQQLQSKITELEIDRNEHM
jgi:hypothetical protein